MILPIIFTIGLITLCVAVMSIKPGTNEVAYMLAKIARYILVPLILVSAVALLILVSERLKIGF